MRLLTVVRHAKSSWDYSELSDFERPLNDRGRRDAPQMAKRMLKVPPRPDLLLSSPATRALTTARLFADETGIKTQDVAVDAKIYDASVDALLKVVRGLDDGARHVVLFGHNPGVSELAHLLADCPFDEFPTCGVARFEFAAKSWADVAPHDGKLLHFIYPKDGT
jgi:phosphohistidine phosphatase